ncbi:putative methyltransferase, partial [Stegodyphus mimosarum]
MADKQFAGKEHAKIYSVYRKDTPVALAEKFISYLKEKYDGSLDTAVDVGCGSGQSTTILASFFKHVYGMDSSEAQIKEAEATRALANVTYKASPAEVLPFPDGSVQMITAGASLHWFDMDAFFPEARRILCNNGILAVYCYYRIKPHLKDPKLTAAVDELFEEHYQETRRYHHPKALIAMERYKDVNFPFEDVLRMPDFREYFEGRLTDIVGYVSTFSGFQNYLKEEKEKAEAFLSHFSSRLQEIAAAENISPEDTIKVYRDFTVIICRKVNS